MKESSNKTLEELKVIYCSILLICSFCSNKTLEELKDDYMLIFDKNTGGSNKTLEELKALKKKRRTLSKKKFQ